MNIPDAAVPEPILQRITQAMGASKVSHIELIQPLWGGYGQLFRAYLLGHSFPSVIVKYIRLPQSTAHPRGWNTPLSHQRKLRSYQVEVNWYQDYANKHLQAFSPLPHCLCVEQDCDETLLVLQDLKTMGFTQIRTTATPNTIRACLTWLGHFHAQYMFVTPTGLWPVGTYWHLDTRPDEYKALAEGPLKSAAKLIDNTLKQCPFQTLVHGDAKLANFCFSEDNRAAAVDFQYIGQGCGMKDVIMLLSSTLNFNEPDSVINDYLEHYFTALTKGLTEFTPHINPQEVEHVWRPLYCVAWADFHRFVKGWSVEHVKINSYTEKLTSKAIEQLSTTFLISY
ncbi:phosphotransferase [Shewanella inventionis]|uniref:Phosphotransferase n=1 Tax=Shewanella inventionis TaxID=1738770 RepID=A0ABQ1JPR3_9GAMM|nr:phosphotransferase [Shewanella inventionis]MCL1159393.1 aminoglycoside phosphotransferase family protein [Shewanella inventionis]GGB71997.1 phosphotransferase [Shewanella inventionis]